MYRIQTFFGFLYFIYIYKAPKWAGCIVSKLFLDFYIFFIFTRPPCCCGCYLHGVMLCTERESLKELWLCLGW